MINKKTTIRSVKPKIWIPGHYTTKIIRGRKTRVWIPGYYPDCSLKVKKCKCEYNKLFVTIRRDR